MNSMFQYFLRLGLTGFGGPLSLVQLMREEFVQNQKSLSSDDFDQAFTMIKAMPGPVAFQMAVFLGFRFYKLKGALLAGLGLLLPSFIMMVGLGFFYDQLTQFHFVKYVLDGFLYSVSAVILLSLKNMVLTSYKKLIFWIILFATLYLTWVQALPEPLLILGFGLLVVFSEKVSLTRTPSLLSVSFLLIDWDKIYGIFKTCFYGGAFVFGTGLAILPVLKSNFVDVHQWLGLTEFNNGVTFGQMTPGPVTITATFLGYQISGFAGALAATVGIFMTPFFHMVTWFPLALNWLSKQSWIKSFLLGATAAVVGSILMTLFKMNELSLHIPMFWILFLATIVLLIKKPKVPLIYVIFAGGLINLVVSLATLYTV